VPEHAGAGLGRKVVDLLVFAPAGLLATAVEDLPAMVAKGRSRLEVHLRNAKFVGELVVTRGQHQLRERADHLLADQRDRQAEPAEDDLARAARLRRVADVADAAGTAGAAGGAEGTVPINGARDTPRAGAGTGTDATDGRAPVPPAPAAANADWAIPDYDALSASQVVRRLDGLGPQELRAVSSYEVATRGRRTILHRVQQLLTGDGPSPG
jgi:hypothetical protein